MSERESLVGRTLAERYRVDSLIARGGMARVYRARDERLDRDVAIKVLSSPYADDPDFTARFLDEARAAASLSHPSLVHVYDSGTDGAAHFIVMELLDRHRTLRDILRERGRLERDEVLRIGEELLAGLRVVHEHGLVHCDVKPANVMLGPGPAKLIDFGIASQPHDGHQGDTSIGSLHFMSPEQLHGEALRPASDLFSLGAVLYEALTGRPPYPGDSPEEVSAAHAAGTVRPPSTLAEGVPGRLDEAILQSLRRDPGSRFHSADAMRVALESAEAGDDASTAAAREDETRVVRTGYVPPPAPAPAPARVERPARRAPSRTPAPTRRRSRSAWPVIGTLLVLGAAALVGLFVIVPLLQMGQGAAPTQGPSVTVTAAPTAESPTVVVPDVVGRPTAEAIETARAAGLNWRVECAQDAAQPEGIIGQEPPAGTSVARGSRFTMFSARISDCR
jgi:serine/threonine-protein kinase